MDIDFLSFLPFDFSFNQRLLPVDQIFKVLRLVVSSGKTYPQRVSNSTRPAQPHNLFAIPNNFSNGSIGPHFPKQGGCSVYNSTSNAISG
jgi:hypothetical protein